MSEIEKKQKNGLPLMIAAQVLAMALRRVLCRGLTAPALALKIAALVLAMAQRQVFCRGLCFGIGVDELSALFGISVDES